MHKMTVLMGAAAVCAILTAQANATPPFVASPVAAAGAAALGVNSNSAFSGAGSESSSGAGASSTAYGGKGGYGYGEGGAAVGQGGSGYGAAGDSAALSGDSSSAGGSAAGGSSGGNSITNKSGDSRSLGIAIGQAPTALSLAGVCGKGTKFVFGAVEWSDYSSKCFNYQIALQAAAQGNWELANQWVERADSIE